MKTINFIKINKHIPSLILLILILGIAIPANMAAAQMMQPEAGITKTAAVQEVPEGAKWHSTDLKAFGLDESLQNYSTQPTLTFWFATREDEVLTHARLYLEFSDDLKNWDGVKNIEIRINNEPVAELTLNDILRKPELTLPFDSRLLSSQNSLTIILDKAKADQCHSQVPPGTWRIIKKGTLETIGSPLPLQNDLAMLPLPFYDVHYDRNPQIPIVLAQPPTTESVKAAGVVAAWFGLLAGSNIQFPVSVGKLPAANAIVLVSSSKPDWLSLIETPEPTIAMMDHPNLKGKKLLVFQGKNDADLVFLARALHFSRSLLFGQKAAIEKSPAPPARLPYDAPRWLPMSPVVEFGSIPGGEKLTHEGLTGGTLSLSFRIAPDLFTWPNDLVRFSIDYTHLTASKELLPEVNVELNGQFVKTLPKPPLDGGMASNSVDLLLHRSKIRGYNRLQFHIAWPNQQQLCDIDPEYAQTAKTVIAPSSKIHFEQVPHFIRMPDVATFVDDGYPFTKLADLSKTAIAIPPDPAPEEISTVLSLMAHFAAVTGYPGIKVTILDTTSAEQGIYQNKDILVVGNARNLDLLKRWSDYLPLELTLGRLRVQKPEAVLTAKAFLGGHLNWKEVENANQILARSPQFSVVTGFESPFQKGRSVVLVTAPTAETMPTIKDLTGFTRAKEAGGDLLVAGQTGRWRFRVGDSYDSGHLGWFTHLRWVNANHWLILLPSLMLAALIFARISKGGLKKRAWQRLHPEGK